MKKKRFVSIYFTPSKLQVVFVDTAKRTVIKYGSFDLPQGIIVNHKVVDPKKLAQVLVSAWTRLGLKEKFVGVIVPEFSTYIKSFKLPKIDTQELDEAVRWQARDVLPASTETVLDWKIIETTESEHTVLAVSIKKDVLTGYVDAVGLAGLSPLVLETPSLSLTRLSDSKESGKLVVYLTFQEALLIVAKGDNIYGTSVTGVDDQGIVSTAQRIIRYYGDVKVGRIVIGGVNLKQSLLTNLHQVFKVQPAWMQAQIGGLNPAQVQEFLVPISLQFKDPREPRDESTINLLPPDWAKSYATKKSKRQIRGLLLNSGAILLTIFLMILGIYLNFNSRLKKLRLETSYLSEGMANNVISKANSINMISEKVVRVTSMSADLEGTVNAITAARLGGIEIKEYTISFDNDRISLQGHSQNRQALVQFKKKLEENEIFTSISIPLSVLEIEHDTEFEMTISLASEEEEEATGTIPLTIPVP